MADIFISYAKKDREKVEPIAHALKEQDWSIFWDRSIPGGKTWDEVIEEELDAAKCVIVVWSKISIKSRWVRAEAEEGLNRNILVPISIEDVKIPLLFRPIQSVRLIHWEGDSNHPQFVKLISDLSPILGPSPLKVRETEQKRVEEELIRKQEEDRKLREEEQRKAEEERQRLEKENQRLAEEEHKQKEAEAKRKAEEQKRKEEKAQIQPDKSEPARNKPSEPKPKTKVPTEPRRSPPIPSKPRKASNALIFGAVAGIIVLLMTGGWFYYKYQQEQQEKETRIEIERFYEQVEELEHSAGKVDNQEQIKGLYEQRDSLSRQIEGFVEKATKVGLESQLADLQNRLNQVQSQLAKKETEFSEVRQEIDKFKRQALELENAVAKVDKPEQIEGLHRQRDTLNNQVAGFSEQATKVGFRSQLEEIQNRLKQIQIQLANKEKELIAARKGSIFVESFPENAMVRILNIDQGFRQGMELEPGKYHLQVSSEGYEPQDRWIEIDPDEEKRVNFELKIIPKISWLHVETVPEGATVRILNIKPKFSQGMELNPGSYHVEVAAEGYKTQRLWVDPVAGQEEPFRVELTKIKVAEQIPPKKAITNSIGMKFVHIPEGSFTMGSQLSPEEIARKYGGQAEYYKDEQPPHPIEITKPFYLQTTEVSQAQWKKVMEEDNPSKFKDCGDDCPVERVSWNDAQKFIRKLNQMEDTNKYRLPTEAEWEYACRARTETAYSFGDEVDKLGEFAWYRDNSESQTHPVGKKKPNAWGLYDMHGNVWEWCQDWYGDYASNSVVDPEGPDKGEYRVLRGGSWDYVAGDLRSALRFRYYPDFRHHYYGFRVARDF